MPSLTRTQKHKIYALANERIRCPAEEAAQESARTTFLTLLCAHLQKGVPSEDAGVLDRYNARLDVIAVRMTLFGQENPYLETPSPTRKLRTVQDCLLPLFPWAIPTREDEHPETEGLRVDPPVLVPVFGWAENGEVKKEQFYPFLGRGRLTYGGVFRIKRENFPPEVITAAVNYHRAMVVHETARETRLTALKVGIDRAKTHKEAHAIWPPAAEVLPETKKKDPLTEADIARIRVQVAGETV